MRVLIVTWEFPPYVEGGLGKHVAELVPYLGGLPVHDGELIVDVLTTNYAGGAPVEQLNSYTTIHRVTHPRSTFLIFTIVWLPTTDRSSSMVSSYSIAKRTI